MADIVGFEREFVKRLKDEKFLFVYEIRCIGKDHGLSRSQVERIIDLAQTMSLGFRDVVFVYLGQDNDGQGY